MAKNEIPFYTKEGKFGAGTSTGTTASLITFGSDGGKLLDLKVFGVAISGSGTVQVQMFINDTTTDKKVFQKTYDSTFSGSVIDVLDDAGLPKDRNSNRFMNLPAGYIVKISVVVANTATIVGYRAYGEDY